MEPLSSRKYNTIFRKKLVSKFEKLTAKSDYLSLYNIITEDIGDNFSSNRNGIFINMNILSDDCINKLMVFVEEKLTPTLIYSETEKVNYKSYKFDEVENLSSMGHKLSNQEKNILKRIKNKPANLN
jgi:hypothetical protein